MLYKGARTLIAAEGKAVAINSTGNPGMATGGVGDVLTGVCAALAGQGLSLYDAACAGSWLLGRSAERWIFERQGSPESLSAGMIIDLLDFEGLRRGIY